MHTLLWLRLLLYYWWIFSAASKNCLPWSSCISTGSGSSPSWPHEYVPPIPKPKTQAYIDWANGSYSAAVTNKERIKLARETGCKGPYSLRRLPHHDRYLSTPVEPVHLLKNVAERIVHTLNGIKDSLKVRREEERGRFRNTWVATGNEKRPLPDAPFSLKPNEVVIADKRLLSIKVPHGTDWKCQKLFDKSISSHMKSVHWRHSCIRNPKILY